MSKRMKRLVRDAAIYFALALGCIEGARYLAGVWHDSLLLIAGVCLGGVCAMVVLIRMRGNREKAARRARAVREARETS